MKTKLLAWPLLFLLICIVAALIIVKYQLYLTNTIKSAI